MTSGFEPPENYPPATEPPTVPPPEPEAGHAPPPHAPPAPRTDALHRPHTLRGPSRGHSDDETTVLTPVTEKTTALDRLSITTRKRLFIVAGASAGLALLLVVFSLYLIAAATQWENRAAELETAAWEMGAELTNEQAKVVEQQGELDLLREQLDVAQERLTELADEKAQERQDNQDAEARIDVLVELNSIGGAVSLALTRCANEQETLMGYLKDADSYSAADLAALEADVKTICDAARSAAAGYQAGLIE